MRISGSVQRVFAIAVVAVVLFASVTPAYAAPSNDNFADAMVITSLPFSTYANVFDATYEAGEPMPSCGYGYQPNSSWFAFTPTVTQSLTANSANYYSVVAVYTGSGLNNLTQVACGAYQSGATAQFQAGVTYYIQLSMLFPWYEGDTTFGLNVTPPPSVSIYYEPYDPSVFDHTYFTANISDPGNIYGGGCVWDMGDAGVFNNDCEFRHVYAADGDYTVNVQYTTADGRSASSSRVVTVVTHDVAITKLGIPTTARVNQTKTINVLVSNKRYTEPVTVTLYKGLPNGGDQMIGTQTINVPARAKLPTTFKFSYTFTPADLTVGKVTFKAVASLVGPRDAFPSDNTAIGSTLVTR